jgi:hypothetical protein
LSQGGLPDLARAEQGDSRLVAKPCFNNGFDAPLDHPCNYGTSFQICKEDAGALVKYMIIKLVGRATLVSLRIA